MQSREGGNINGRKQALLLGVPLPSGGSIWPWRMVEKETSNMVSDKDEMMQQSGE